MKIHEGLVTVICFFFQMICCDPVQTKAVSVESPLPSFVWSSPVSIHVVYPDQVHDHISLRLANTVDGFIDCLYKGSFLLETEATATISGCKGYETTYISIFSDHLLPGQFMFSFDKNNTQEIANPYLNLRNESDYGLKKRKKRNIIYEDYEYEVEDYDDDISYDSALKAPPSPLTMKIKLAFDMSLVRRLGSEDEGRKHIIQVHEHAKEHLKNVLHPSLGTQIFLQVVGSPQFIRKSLEPTRKGLKDVEVYKENEPIPLFTMVSTDDTDILMGVSNTRKGCHDMEGLMIIKRRENIMTAVITYLHELSHLFGVRHDGQEDRLNGNNECENTGIMSQIKPDFTVEQRAQLGKYSTCSSTRFSKWFWRDGKTCMIPGILNIDDNDAKCSLLERKCKSVASVPGDILQSGCTKPKNIKNGIWSCSEDGVHCHPNCDEGYKLNHRSKSFVKCRNNQWNGNPLDFRCTCDFNYIPDNAESLSCSGHSCQVTCKPGYSAPQITQTTCQEDGWSVTPESLVCISKPSCEIPSPPDHGIWLCKNGDCRCQLSCTAGYQPSDLQEIIYDPGWNQWNIKPSTFSCIATEAQVVLLAGGKVGTGIEKSVEIFDPEGRCNIHLPDLPFGLMFHTAHYLSNNGDVLLCGGLNRKAKSPSCSKLVGQVFVHHSNLVELRLMHTGVVLDNKIYLLGGMLRPGKGSTSMESLTSTGATWSKENVELEEGRNAACAVETSETTFLVIGGVSSDSEGKHTFIDKTQVVEYDSTTQTWTTLEPMLGGGRAFHSCLYLGNGLVVVAGGLQGPQSDSILSSSLIYYINTNTWSTAGNLHKNRAGGAIVKTNGRVFFVGGIDKLDTPLDVGQHRGIPSRK